MENKGDKDREHERLLDYNSKEEKSFANSWN